MNLIDDADITISKIIKFAHCYYDPNTEYTEPSFRPYHSIQLRLSGYTVFTSKNGVIRSKPGDIIYLPKGTEYSKSNRIGGECYQVLFSVSKDYDIHERVIHPKSPELFSELFKKGIRNDFRNSIALKAMRMSIVYEIIGNFQKTYEAEYCPNDKLKLIQPAVDYLSENFSGNTTSVSFLAELCGISETYYRQIFQKVYGMNPSRYLQHIRISEAKKLLLSGYNIQTVSEMCGFCDSSYFTKVFLKECSILPSEYTREYDGRI